MSNVIGGASTPTTYQLLDEQRVAGAFAAAGLGYRLPFASIMELRGSLLVGVLFNRSRDLVSGMASIPGSSGAVRMLGTTDNVSSPNLLVMPKLQLGVRMGDFNLGLDFAALVVTLPGPETPVGETATNHLGCDSNVTVGCMPGVALHRDADGKPFRGHGSFVTMLPGESAGYRF